MNDTKHTEGTMTKHLSSDNLTAKQAEELAIEYAKLVVGLCEDERPAQAIEAKVAWLAGELSDEELERIGNKASDYAWHLSELALKTDSTQEGSSLHAQSAAARAAYQCCLGAKHFSPWNAAKNTFDHVAEAAAFNAAATLDVEDRKYQPWMLAWREVYCQAEVKAKRSIRAKMVRMAKSAK